MQSENTNTNNKELNEDKTLIWNNNNEEETKEFEELAGINKTAMKNVISELAEDNNTGENSNTSDEFNNFQETKEQPSIFANNEDEAREEAVPAQESIITEEIKQEEANNEESNNFFNFRNEGDEGIEPKVESSEVGIDNTVSEESTLAKVPSDEVVVMSTQKISLIKKLVANIQDNSKRVEELLGNHIEDSDLARIKEFSSLSAEDEEELEKEIEGKIIEGVFNGQCMIGPDGKQYNVPSNYASKSKLVEGDILKLTINNLGKFIYKQIGPIDRNRIVGILVLGNNSEYHVEQDGKKWRILTASVTYFKGNLGDETVILVPKQGESNWAAVENIVNKL